MKQNLNEIPVRESLAAGEYNRCYACFRPLNACFCDSIPSINNRTEVLILQHPRERFHPFNTARIVRLALQNSSLIFGETQRLATSELPFHANAGLLYPSDSAPLLSELTEEQRPQQLVVVDGTWHHAKTLVRDIPSLQALPRFRLAPTTPGRYRIRREPNETALSTLEATVAALRSLEPETEGLNRLLNAFDQMVEGQLVHSSSRPRWRQKESRTRFSMNVPRKLLSEWESVVVAYGELEEGQRNGPQKKKDRQPVYWTAERIATGELFRCLIQPPGRPISESFLHHLELTTEHFRDAVTIDEFRNRWRRFVKDDDIVAVYGNNTAGLLARCNADFCRSLALKSIDFNKDRRYQTLSDLIDGEQIKVEPPKAPRTSRKTVSQLSRFRPPSGSSRTATEIRQSSFGKLMLHRV